MSADAKDAMDALAAEQMPDHRAIRDLRNRAVHIAQNLIREAKDPIAIGVVGEYTVGKSMLLGTLLGRPDLLPVEERATTGNITALYLKPGQPGQTTYIDGSASVHFVSELELTECVAYMLGELSGKLRDGGRGADTGPPKDYDPVTDGWERLEHWCRGVLWPENGKPGSLEPRKIAAELLAVRDAHLSAEAVLGKEAVISREVVRSALDLGKLEEVPDSFPVRDLRHGLALDDVKHDGADLAKTFPLIRRVSYTVRIDPGCWTLNSLRDQHSVVLLDFPGLTSARSGSRDRFLSRHEFENIHTIITVFWSPKPGNEVPQTFFTMLESHGLDPGTLRDYIIAAGNAFDKVRPPSIDHGGPLTLDELQDKSQPFRDLTISASDLTQRRDDRIRLVSSVAAIKKYGYPRDEFGDHQQALLDEAMLGVESVQRRWGELGDRLAVGDPGNLWAQALADFGLDGGISSLRQLIESHACEHGLVNKTTALKAKWDQLLHTLTQLEGLLPTEELSQDAVSGARLRIDQLCDRFRRQLAQATESARLFRDPLRLTRSGEQVIESARQRCMAEVMSWEDWHNLILNTEDGLITKSVSAASHDDGGFDPFADIGDPTAGTGGDTTELFFGRFCSVFMKAVNDARTSLTASVAEWIGDRNAEASSLRGDLNDARTAELLAAGGKRLAAAGGPSVNWAAGLGRLADLSWASAMMAAVQGSRPVTEDGIATGFPLTRQRALPWNAQIEENSADPEQRLERHQMYLFRMRRELAVALADGVAFWLAGDIAEFHGQLRRQLQRGKDYVPNPGQVRGMFPDSRSSAHPDGDDRDKADAPASSLRALLREWRARDAAPGI